ncbi:MAG: hypothetical protein CO150_07825 [Nitrospirae bacterium CG_4_9_14_3_um_filter_53_35]|nr:MAG: hypothetical protein AUK29_09210 [Nitrospirae bacterium CG2_30_53_67]PIS36900.1 MAG: hypothetical protein COT35_08820 [Nitrospirae bacterium CG08_land_8_20_14_0_20_52_24]PIV85185.1 MAG: hypothetical protein COW52_03610 [Nitrospirae bacterium CG17_big_fil_post_rev_8_21_14_2_50_50_9]PIW84535.1 MAG: hypothetical protein COZ95_09255 [Nitrospirae bacterium CG_4_8_14_3_um_filter_50_41]PIX86316.1 MAG: hypothetical protein COZ32_04010 [Nitrospirae bacterium CG_4_10_14_3_um_filter_53_41]PJA7358
MDRSTNHVPQIPRLLLITAWLIMPAAFGLLAIVMGQDAGWDLRNYHFYNPYAFLHGRMNFDIVPAQVANFYNPILYVPFYEMVVHLPPKAVGFLLGTVQGLNFPVLFLIAHRLLVPLHGRKAAFLGFVIALTGVLGAGNLSEVGAMSADNILSILVLVSLLIVLANDARLSGAPSPGLLVRVAGAGAAAGLAAGLKQPAAIFAVGLCAAFLTVPASPKRRVLYALWFGLGVLAGVAMTDGYWMVRLWVKFGNPLFPYFNDLFQSPMATIGNYRDERFLPQGVLETVFFPLLFALNSLHTSEIYFRDLRIPLLYGLLMVLALHAILRLRAAPGLRHETHSMEPHLSVFGVRFMLTAGVVSYLAWLKLFSIYRYITIIEMLAPLGIWLILARIFSGRRIRMAAGLMALVLVLATLRPAAWGRIPWSNDYFGVTPPTLADPDHTMALMAGYDPMAYVIPFFPQAIRFLRIQSYFTGPSDQPNGFDRLMHQLVAEHSGPLYILYRSYEQDAARAALQAYGLQLQSGRCQALRPHIEAGLKDPLLFCPAVRQEQSDPLHG